jgi:hypothetical protein
MASGGGLAPVAGVEEAPLEPEITDDLPEDRKADRVAVAVVREAAVGPNVGVGKDDLAALARAK